MRTRLRQFAGGFLGDRLIGLLQQTARPNVTAHWGGSNILGVVIGGSIVAVLYIRHYGIPLGQPFDLGGLPVPLGQAIGRIGCFAAGCCYFKATDSWLGPNLLNNRGEWAVRYPTQLMSAATDLLIFVGLVAVERYGKRQLNRRGDGPRRSHRGWPFDGFIFLLYADLYCLKRFGMEFLRGDALPPPWSGSSSGAGLTGTGVRIVLAGETVPAVAATLCPKIGIEPSLSLPLSPATVR